MASEICVEKKRNEEDSLRETVPLLNISFMEAKNVEKSNPKLTDGKAVLITPDTDRENGEAIVDFKSPLTWVLSPPRTDEVVGSELSPRTPEEDVFDPFAPGPEELILAPRCKKYKEFRRKSVSQRLNFDSSVEPMEVDSMESLSEEQMFLDTVYESILEAVVSKQVKRVTAETPLPLHRDCDGFKTPESLPRLNGVVETCPGAPVKVKPTKELRNIKRGLCRKLEF